MNSTDLEVIRTAIDWLQRGHRAVLGTVVKTWGSAPRPLGSLMVIRDDGQVVGSVSGGCIEDDLVGRVARGELDGQRPSLTTYGATAEESRRFGLPCAGTVQIVLEPLSTASRLPQLLADIEAHRLVARRLDLATGDVALAPARPGDALRFDEEALVTVHGPGMRLLVVGGGQLSRYLASMAVMLGYHVTVCEPRAEYHEGWERLEGVTLTTAMPDDAVLALRPDPHTAIVCVTHDPKLDDLALIEALQSPAFYVGALGSRRNNEARRRRLHEHFDLEEQALARLRGPVGLKLGAVTPPEIAMAIVAEMTALRRGADLRQPLTDWSSSKTECRLAA